MNATIIQPDLKGFSLVALTPEPLRNNVAIPFSSIYKVFPSFLPFLFSFSCPYFLPPSFHVSFPLSVPPAPCWAPLCTGDQ